MSEFMDWLASTIPDTPEMKAIDKEERQRYQLAKGLSMARKRVGHTQKSLAQELGVSQAQVSKWEHINGNVTFHTLQMLSQHLGMELVVGLQHGHEYIALVGNNPSSTPPQIMQQAENYSKEHRVDFTSVTQTALVE